MDGNTHTVIETGYPATLTPNLVNTDHNGTSGTISVNASAGVSWTAVSNLPWLTLSPSSGTGFGTVTYSIASYANVATQTGLATIAGQTFTVNQTGVAVVVSPATVSKGQGSDIILLDLTALATTNWTISPQVPWISVVDGGSGQGSSAIVLAASSNPSYLARTGMVNFGSFVVTVTQDPLTTAALDINPKNTTASYQGAVGNIAVSASPDAPWTASSLSPWITLGTGSSSGISNGNIGYVVSSNPTISTRTGQILVNGPPPSSSAHDFTRGLLLCFNGRNDFARSAIQISGPSSYPVFDGTSRAYLPDAARKATSDWALAFTFTHNSNGAIHQLMGYNAGGQTLAAWVDINNNLNVRVGTNVQIIGDVGVMAGQSYFVLMQGSTSDVQVFLCVTGNAPVQKLAFTTPNSIFPPNTNLSPVEIGGSSFPTTGNFVGTLNFLSVHDRKLTGFEIQNYLQTTPFTDLGGSPLSSLSIQRTSALVTPAAALLLRGNILDQISGGVNAVGLVNTTGNQLLMDLFGSLDRYGRLGESLKIHASGQRLNKNGGFNSLSFWVKSSNTQNQNIWGFGATGGLVWSRLKYTAKSNLGQTINSYLNSSASGQTFYSIHTDANSAISIQQTKVTAGAFYPDVTHSNPPNTVYNSPYTYSLVGYDTGWDPTKNSQLSTGQLVPNQWHHIGLSLSASGVVTLILDGVNVGSMAGFSSDLSGQQFQNIGGDSYPSWINKPASMANLANQSFEGEIDDVAIYNEELSEQEIRALFSTQQPVQVIHSVSQGVSPITLTPANPIASANGGEVDTQLTLADNVTWTASSDSAWLTMLSSASGAGPGIVKWQAATNPTVYQRQATVTVAGATAVISQLGRTVTVSSGSVVLSPDGGSVNISVSAEAGASWNAVPVDSWLSVIAGATGVGTGSVTIVADPYNQTTSSRTGTVIVAGKTVYVTQRGYTLTVSPTAAQFYSVASSANISVAAPVSAIWSAIASDPWITITGGFNGMGTGTIYYTVASNGTGQARSGRIVVSGAEYVVNQSVVVPDPVTFTTQPLGGSVNPLQSFNLSVAVSGSAPFTYQWRRNLQTIAGATTSSYAIVSATEGDQGSYDVIVSNIVGSVTSQAATVNVNLSPSTVTSPTFSAVTGTSATLGGNVTSDGYASITSRGVVLSQTSTNSNPQIGGTGVINVTGTGTTGVFTVNASSLAPITAYSFAAYATNSQGTSYSATGSFATLSINANLAGLVLSSGTLSPVFAAATTSYTASVPNATASLTVTPTVADGTATAKVNGVSVISGSASAAIALSVGANTITTLVTAQDGTTTKTYTLVITRQAPPTVSSPTIAAVTGTSATLGGNVSSDGNATITARGIVLSPTTTNSNPQIGGTGVVNVTGTGTTGVFTVNASSLTPATTYSFAAYATNSQGTSYSTTGTFSTLSNNANLSTLVLSSGTLSPVFASATTSYTASVPNATASLTVTPTVAAGTATVKVNGVSVTSGSASASIALNIGANTFTTLVTAQDGTTTKTYTAVVTRISNNANLSGLVLSSGALSPAFAAATTSYTAIVSNATASLTVTPTVADGTATVMVNGISVTSGSASAGIALNVGANTITTLVTAQDGTTTRTYTTVVTRISNNANLSALALSNGTLSPSFVSATTSYTASVPNATASLTVTPTVADGTATVKVNGVSVTSGSASSSIALSVGANTITMLVTAQDGTTTKSYTTVVTRISTNANLSSLALSSGTLSPAFASATTSYTASVPNATASLTVTPTLADSTATVMVNGVSVASGSASAAIALSAGSNTITTLVTAQDSTTTKTYTVTITRLAPPTVATPLYSGVTGTSATLGGDVTSDGNATITARGIVRAPTSINSNPQIGGTGVVNVTGTGTTGVFTVNAGTLAPITDYSFAAYATNSQGTSYSPTGTFSTLSNNASLSILALSNGALSPAFASATTSYTASVPNATASLMVTPTVVDGTALVRVNGVSVTSGSASAAIALNVGSNIITTVVTAQDGTTTKTYTVTITRLAPPLVSMPTSTAVTGTSVTLGGNVTSDGFAGITSRGVVLSQTSTNNSPEIGGTGVINVAGIGTTGVFTVNFSSLTPGTAYSFAAYATNSEGTSYSITGAITTLSNNANLGGLVLSSGTLSPAFTSSTFGYSVSLPGSVSAIAITPTLADATAGVTINGMAVASGTASASISVGLQGTIISLVVTAQDGITTQSYTISVNGPILVVQQNGTSLVRGAGISDFGGQVPGRTVARMFTVKNAGKAVLTGFGFSFNGANAVDFTVTTPPAASVSSGGSTTFTVTFNPSDLGARSATLHISSNDTINGPFDVNLAGIGAAMPAITAQPASLLVGVGLPATFTVAASGGALSYQWLLNNGVVPGATGSSYSIPATALGNAGSYSVTVSNAAGSANSLVANLGVVSLASSTVSLVKGKSITLTASAAGPNLTYQWRKSGSSLADGINPVNSLGTIAGSTSSKLSITNSVTADGNNYDCLVTMPIPQSPGTFLNLASGGSIVNIIIAKPTLDPFTPRTWIVGGTVTDVVTAQNYPTSYKVTGQPAGVAIDAKGHFYGKPTVAILTDTIYRITITASNPDGTSAPLITNVTVKALPRETIGDFNGLVDRDAALTRGYGGTIKVATLNSGIFSGKLALGAQSYSFTGQRLNASDGADPSATVIIARTLPLPKLTLAFSIDQYSGELYGSVSDGVNAPVSVNAWHNPWNAVSNKAPLAAIYTSELALGLALAGTTSTPGNVAYPQGTGYGTLTISTSGVATWAGKVADGAVTTASTTMGPTGDVPLHFMLYKNTGSAHGWVTASADSVSNPSNSGLRLLDGSLDWMKSQAASSADRSYNAGFLLHSLTVIGGEYVKPGTSMVILGLTDGGVGTTNAKLVFSEGGLTGPAPIVAATNATAANKSFRIAATTQAVTLPTSANNPAGLTLSLKASTGAFSGSFVLKGDQDPTATKVSLLSRTVSYYGLLVPRVGVKHGVGFLLLPELPSLGLPITTLSTSPIYSGKVLLEAGP